MKPTTEVRVVHTAYGWRATAIAKRSGYFDVKFGETKEKAERKALSALAALLDAKIAEIIELLEK